MKKLSALALTLIMLATMVFSVFATTADVVEVYVTIADANGMLALAQEKISVTDIDNDDVLTINDALYCAHEAKYKGGAKAGYASSNSDYGLSLVKLWGESNSSGFGYYVNNASAWSLGDIVKNGDFVNAFVYTDLTTWSDTYCYFDVNTVQVKTGDEINLALSASGYDENYNPITLPVADATITVNGVATNYVTDAQGKVTVKINKAGTCVISATSSTQILVPPVCVADVTGESQTENKISLNAKSKKLNAGETFTLLVKNAGDSKVTFKSNKTGVLKVSEKGKVTALKKGTATITAKVKGKGTLKCTVKVKNDPKLTSSKKSNIEIKKITLNQGQSKKLYIKGKATAVKNKYTDTKVAKIKGSVKKAQFTVKAVKKGTTTLKIKVNGSKVLKLKVVVRK